jgi:hypothetical protein
MSKVMAGVNGHTAAEQARHAEVMEQRRREVVAAYLALSDVLLDSFERLAMMQDVSARLGGLQLVVAIRRRRAKERMKATA